MDDIKLSKVENVRIMDRYNSKTPIVGTLYLTATHLIFVEPETNKETWILHMHIASIDKLPLSTTGSPLLIRCKTFLSITFVIPKDSECHEVYMSLVKLHQPLQISKLYCFTYSPGKENLSKSHGWDYFMLENEFQRMQVPNESWILCNLNVNYELCSTYPKYLYIPTEASSSILLGSSKFRSKGRLPVLTYLHTNKAAICRCSQPLSGFSARCLEDEQMLEAIRKANPNVHYMYVVDTRPRINAMANRATGKGYENEAFYENIKFQFQSIENIHVMRASLQKLIELCEQKSPTMNGFLNSLESSGWLKHIRSILDTSRFIANAINTGVSVVVHCSDGWDRTAQVCSIASLMLDPYYRTVKGFQVLIEKDWLAFGHKFNDRCGHIQTDPKEISPVFTQFLDSVWQLMSQRCNAFEFNEHFLLAIHDHVYSCQFGTFIGNCEKDRLDLKLSERTYSLWNFIENHIDEYINPLYGPGGQDLLNLSLAPQSIKFWRGMYSRFESGVHPREPVPDVLIACRDHCGSLESQINLLTNKIGRLKNFISKAYLDRRAIGSCNELIEDDISDSQGNVSDLIRSDIIPSWDFSESLSISQSLKCNQEEFNSVSVDWKSVRNATVCSCLTPFDQFIKKNHCWKCGDVFCSRCIERSTIRGHTSGKLIPVCRMCLRLI